MVDADSSEGTPHVPGELANLPPLSTLIKVDILLRTLLFDVWYKCVLLIGLAVARADACLYTRRITSSFFVLCHSFGLEGYLRLAKNTDERFTDLCFPGWQGLAVCSTQRPQCALCICLHCQAVPWGAERTATTGLRGIYTCVKEYYAQHTVSDLSLVHMVSYSFTLA